MKKRQSVFKRAIPWTEIVLAILIAWTVLTTAMN